jgi:hypothetical protein
MHNKELVTQLLSIKDPETLMRKVHSLPARKVSVLMFDDELVARVGKIIYHNPEIREKIEQENDRPEYNKIKGEK